MIIKIKTNGEDEWRFYDDAREVQKGTIAESSIPKLDNIQPDTWNYGFDTDSGIHEEVMINASMPTHEHVALITFITHDRATNLYTNSTVYLLNDNGKTIERLN